MNRNETIKSIKESLKKLFAAEAKQFSDFVLTDGTKITSTASDLEIGVEVYAVDDMGNQTPLNDGDYVLNDGRTITVVGNSITNIAGGSDTTEAETPVSDANVANTAMADGLADTPADESNLASRVTDLEAQLEEILNMLKTMSEGTAQAQSQMMSAVEKISGEPGAEAIKPAKKGYEEYNSKKINSRINMSEIEELRALISNKNKINF
jgi:Tfp pilus assembly protein FimV